MKFATLPDLVGAQGIFTDGDWVESKDQDPDGDVRLIQLADVGLGNFVNKSSRYLTSEKAKELRCTLLKERDILIARMPDPIGRACVFPAIDQSCATVVDVCVLRVDADIADANYVAWMINSPQFLQEVFKHSKGSTRQRISRKNLAALPIPLPPLDEQKRIAAILDQADALRRLRRRALDRLNTLGQAIFRDLFTPDHAQVPLSELAELNPRRKFPTTDDYPVTFLPMAAVSEDGSILHEEVRLLSQVRKGFTYFERGDVLVAKITPCFENGKGCLTQDISQDVGFGSTEFHVMRPEGSDMGKFLHLVAQSSRFRKEGERSMTGSAGQKRVPADFIANYKVPSPGRYALQSLGSRLNAVAPMRRAAETAAVCSDTLFASLQHRAFRGEL